MTTVEERREVARRLRELDYSDLQESLICAYLDALGIKGYEDWIGIAHRLADLIEPTDGFDLDTVARVCFECLEGCDEPEYTLYDTILTAITRYKHGESGLPLEMLVDRDALLAMAEEMVEMFRIGAFTGEGLDARGCRVLHGEYARRIREACGEGA